jgi:glycosyltransferase involved in cell wall biosynthesis
MSTTVPHRPAALRESSGAEIRADLLVHALAQLPNELRAAVGADGAERDRITLLARAYGVEDRVIFEGSGFGSPCGRLVRPAEDRPLDASGATTMAELIEAASSPGDLGASLRYDDDLFAGERIAFVTNLPAPYRIPLFHQIHRRLAAAGSDFRVFFLAERARARAWMTSGTPIMFEHEFVSSVELPLRKRRPLLPVNKRRPLVPVNLERRLASFDPAVVLTAGFSPFVSGRAARYAERRGVLLGLWSGEISTTSTAKSRLRRLQRARLAARFDFGIVYGFHAGEYLRRLCPDLPLVYGRNTSPVSPLPRQRPARPSPVELLAVGDLTSPNKGIDVLVDALRLLPGLPCRLTVIGGGRLLPMLEESARRDRRIRFLGSMRPEGVRDFYGRADVFLFPSRGDIFGLALVEAMGSGLAVLSSRNPGAVGDVSVNGRNTLLIDGHRPEAWAAPIERIVLDHDLRRSLGEAASTTISRRWTIEHAADAMIAGLRLGLFLGAQRGAG